MRIRKRQLSLPFSSLSDPPLVQLPDLHRPTTTAFLVKEMEEFEDIRERSEFGVETSNVVLSQSTSSSSTQVVGWWCEKEKAFPLKKRRGSFEKPIDDQDRTTTMKPVRDDQKKIMKTKVNKKCTLPQKQEDDRSELGLDLPGKKKSRGGALMEGSRCSRVNGRGWRCCQQTLVGYSLCEHHLGKGRLRSMNSVRSRSLAASKAVIAVDEEDEKKPSPSPPSSMFTSKKRMKLGVVKARSISSLLGQTDNVMAAAAAPPSSPPSVDDNIDE